MSGTSGELDVQIPSREDLESLSLQLAIDCHENLLDDITAPYVKGRRDAHLLTAAVAAGHEDLELTHAVTALRQAFQDGHPDVNSLRGILHRTSKRVPTPATPLEWVGPKAFNARHGDRGLDEDLGMRWGPKHDLRISFKRQPGADQGLLYAYDKTWDTYAVIAVTTSRTLAQQTFRRALETNPDMTADDFARHHETLRTAARTRNMARTVSL
ncbi:hypothetical protein [Knoellia subterranea]|uniref:Uncharacterized protein n=1 Tax=Knoellia subterranea KCTC 19937 TaxID=1385521 RepID=A0A0A0JMM2_9MICO|nr:hypothetical protein [Knoellia subterranea]KGN37317.1 hypothetical protein N803_15715 [Knoellia subterranea KCTC 19937]